MKPADTRARQSPGPGHRIYSATASVTASLRSTNERRCPPRAAPDPDVPLYFEAASIKPSDPANPPGQGIRLQPGGRFNTFFAALQEQLGLKLDATKGPVEVWVIDSVEHPTPD